LAPAIARLAEGAGAAHSIESIGGVAPDVALVVWFTCAEALANTAKHAAGSRVHVQLTRNGEVFELTVTDTGTGGADASGPGLSGLRDRADAVGATLTVNEGGSCGTVVRLNGQRDGDRARCHVPEHAPTPIPASLASGTMNT
jgi:signal transduction histidine kinase